MTRAQALYAFVAPAQTSVYLRLNTGLSSVYGNTPAFPYSLYSASSGGTAITDALPSGTALWTGGPTAASNVGSYNLTYSSGITLGSSSYLLNTGGAVSYAITPRPITLTADAKTKVYGQADPALTYTIGAGLVGSDTFAGVLTRAAGDNVGEYAISAAALANANYAITRVNNTLTISHPPVSATTAVSTVYVLPPTVARPASVQLTPTPLLVQVAPAATPQANENKALNSVILNPAAVANRTPGTVLVIGEGIKTDGLGWRNAIKRFINR